MADFGGEYQINDLMARSGVEFGTSGARGRVAAMTDFICYAYTTGFLHYWGEREDVRGRDVAIGGDLRSSTPRILRAVARAVRDEGAVPVFCGFLPSPALALYGIERRIPAIMVTGSHIPDDRNGIKYNLPVGEISKADEAGIRAQRVCFPGGLFDEDGMLRCREELATATPDAIGRYEDRYLRTFPSNSLSGLRIGLYEHSAVGRDVLGRILEGLGATVTRLGPSERFIPVDTEALREEDVVLAREWASQGRFDAIVTTDGDSDRPLISDETGKWLRGDVAGILCARFLKAGTVALPVSCNTAAERCGAFSTVRRTRIGSPYVIAAMEEAKRLGQGRVVGYEANGGFLTATPLSVGNAVLPPLPTRDAVIPILAVLSTAATRRVPVSLLVEELPRRFTWSARLQEFPTEASRSRLEALTSGELPDQKRRFAEAFGGSLGEVDRLDLTDGLRATFRSGEIVHLRPSGNAPEFRCYTEADSEQRAAELNRHCLTVMESWRPPEA